MEFSFGVFEGRQPIVGTNARKDIKDYIPRSLNPYS